MRFLLFQDGGKQVFAGDFPAVAQVEDEAVADILDALAPIVGVGNHGIHRLRQTIERIGRKRNANLIA